jgi:hypothetical protein
MTLRFECRGTGTLVYNGPVARRNQPDVNPGVSGPIYRIELYIGSQMRTGVITEETKKKLLEHADELSELGVRIEYGDVVSRHDTVHFWNVWNVQTAIDVIAVAEWLHPGIVRKVVRFLRDLAIPDVEIQVLGLGKPEQILDYSRIDKKQPETAVKWKGMRNAPRPQPVISTPTERKRGSPKKKAHPGPRRKRKGR